MQMRFRAIMIFFFLTLGLTAFAQFDIPNLPKEEKGVYNYINKRNLGFEMRDLRKVNFTINVSKVDPLLAEFMQGRRGNVSQKHYFLPSMENNYRKWLRADSVYDRIPQ